MGAMKQRRGEKEEPEKQAEKEGPETQVRNKRGLSPAVSPESACSRPMGQNRNPTHRHQYLEKFTVQ